MALILLDTDVLIDAGRGFDDAVTLLDQVSLHGQPGISVVTQMELIVGCRDKGELSALDRFLETFSILPLDGATSTKAVSLLQRYRLSHGLLIADALIAATAIMLDAPFVSKNQKDYRYLRELNLGPYPVDFEEWLGRDEAS